MIEVQDFPAVVTMDPTAAACGAVETSRRLYLNYFQDCSLNPKSWKLRVELGNLLTNSARNYRIRHDAPDFISV